MNKGNSTGFTLIEAVTALAILVVALSLALSGYIFLLKNANQASVQHELDVDVQLAIESLKKDLRLSSMERIFYYPEGTPPYTAISFPVAYDSDGDGLVEYDASGRIVWDETIIYHIRPGSPDELVKTSFKPRIDTLLDDARQDQLNAVVANGSGTGSGVANGANASSKVIFANLLNWQLNPRSGQFSGYAENNQRESIALGYVLLDPGLHTFTFKVTGKALGSSGYNIGIDQFMATPSYHYCEAEDQSVIAENGASASREYNPSYGNRHQLFFPATKEGDYFTIQLPNDRWKDTNFGGQFSAQDKTSVETDYTLDPFDVVVKLEGMDITWEAETQSGDFQGHNPTNSMVNTVVRTMLKGGNLENNGSFLESNGGKCRLTFAASTQHALEIDHVFFGESSNPNSTIMAFNTTPTQATFAGDKLVEITKGETVATDWIDIPIDTDKNYIVSYAITGTAENNDAPRMWTDNRGTLPTTQIARIDSTVSALDVAQMTTDWVTGLSTNSPGTTNWFSSEIIGLAAVETSYANEGTYTSDILDTMLDNTPDYTDISWNADIPSQTTLGFKFRTGDQFDLSGAPAWSNLTEFASARSVSPIKRYIQFQTLMETSNPEQTPVLKDVTLEWTGERRMVNINGKFSKGPNYGDFELSVDGKPLQSALIINLQIYRKTQAMNHEMREITSAIKVEITPRNSGL